VSESTQTRPQRGAELELTVDSLAYGGAGVARLDGYVVFVHDAFPGDRVRARITKSKRAYAEGRAIELLEPSADRVQPRAQHPGAPWQVLSYERQL
jgi:23S rRNA (uracil1939-C5)-methyltransferase